MNAMALPGAAYRVVASLTLAILQLYASILTAFMLLPVLAGRMPGGFANWVLVGCWWFATGVMIFGGSKMLIRIAGYFACLPVLYGLGTAVIAVSMISDRYANSPLNMLYATGILGIVGSLPLPVGIFVRWSVE